MTKSSTFLAEIEGLETHYYHSGILIKDIPGRL